MSNISFGLPVEYDLFLAGDICPISDNTNQELNLDASLLEVMRLARFRAVNLECPITDHRQSIPKTGPALKAPASALTLLSRMKVDLVNLANNHIMDFGVNGAKDTISYLEKANIRYSGLSKLGEETYTTVDIGEARLGFVSFTENEFSTLTYGNWRAQPMDFYLQFQQISKARENTDFVVVQYHGGAEMYPFPSPGQKRYAHYLADLGASIVICHHSHRYSGFEIYKDVPIFYGLGNFYFPKAGEPEAFYVGLSLCISLSNPLQVGVLPIIHAMKSACLNASLSNLSKIKADIEMINEIIESDVQLENAWEEFCAKSLHSSLSAFQSNSRIHKAFGKLGIKQTYKGRVNIGLLNRIRCETHRERLLTVLHMLLLKQDQR